jgi:hypothetical protein
MILGKANLKRPYWASQANAEPESGEPVAYQSNEDTCGLPWETIKTQNHMDSRNSLIMGRYIVATWHRCF